MSVTFLNILPVWGVAAVACGLVLLLAHGSFVLRGKKVPNRWILYLGLLRIVATVLFVACLMRPVITRTRSAPRESAMLVLLDASGSMGPTHSGDPSSRLGRVLADMRKSGLTGRLDAGFDVRWFTFDEDARPISAAEARSIEAGGKATRMGLSLQTAWDYYRQGGGDGSKAGSGDILVVSDGNDLGGRNVAETARRLGAAIHTLAPPDVEPPPAAPTVDVVSLQSTRRVLLGSECRFRAVLRPDGVADVPLVVKLSEGEEQVMSQPLQFLPGEAERQLSFAFRPAALGARQYTLTVAPADDTRTVAGRPYTITVNVVGHGNHVLLFEDTWRWTFKFLRRVFEDDPSFSFTAFLSRGAGIYMQFAEPDRKVTLSGFPQSKAELQWFDMIVLGDVNPDRWPSALAPAIHDLVVEHGRSLVVIAGPGIMRIAGNPYLEPLLPVELTPESATPIEGPVRVQPGPGAEHSPLFYSAQEGAASVDWKNLSSMDHVYPALRKRPAATILIEAPERANAFGSLIVAAEHTVGHGRVLFLASDTLWKWQMLTPSDEADNSPYQVFWQQALRAMTPVRHAAGTLDFWFQADRTKYTVSDKVTLTAEIEGDGLAATPRVEGGARLPDGREFPLSFLRDPVRPGFFLAEFEATQAGHYRVNASLISGGKDLAAESTTLDVDPMPGELARRGNNTGLLKNMADATGGRCVDLADPATWPERDTAEAPVVTSTRMIDPWNDFSLLFSLVAVLALDWLLRLLRGFV